MATELIVEEECLVPIRAEDDIRHIKGTIRRWLAETQETIVNSDASYKAITSLYARAREWKKTIEAKRKELNEPLRKKMAETNDKAKALTDPLDQIITMANTKVNSYHKFLEDLKRKEEEDLRAEAAMFDAEDEVYVAPLEKVLRGDGAVSVTKTEKQFKVVDISKVPTKYLMVNEKAVEQDLRLGIEEIPGLEITQITTTQLRIR